MKGPPARIASLSAASATNAIVTIPAVTRQIHMKMVAMVGVRIRAEDRRERSAGTLMHLPQEGALTRISEPALLDAYLATVGQDERANVESVSMSVL